MYLLLGIFWFIFALAACASKQDFNVIVSLFSLSGLFLLLTEISVIRAQLVKMNEKSKEDVKDVDKTQ